MPPPTGLVGVAEVELQEDGMDVALAGALGDHQPLGNRLVAHAFGDQTDCGFGTFIRWSRVAGRRGVAWLELQTLAEGAQIASSEL